MSSSHEPASRKDRDAAALSRPSVAISRRVGFSASHRLSNPQWSPERNREVFGTEANPLGHGHNYELEVTVAGPVDPETGMVINLREVDAILREYVLEAFDRRFINAEVPGCERLNPTAENLAVVIWSRLEGPLRERGARLVRVRLQETPDHWVDYYGEEDGES